MPVTTLAEALPLVAWVTLVSLAAGGFAVAALTGQLSEATRGYLRFTAVSSALLALLALALDTGLPTPTVLAIEPAAPELDAVRRFGLAGLAVSALAYAFVLADVRRRLVLGLIGLGSTSVVVVAASFGWAPTSVDAVPFAVQLVSLSVVTGGAMAAVALGHWYLVTPKISVGPLVLQARLLLAALVVQALLFIVWSTLGGGIGQGAWDALTGPSALLVWLRGVVTVAFPVVLAYMALKTAQTRSMESATGLLYINLAAVLAGTIGAAALYVSTGLLV